MCWLVHVCITTTCKLFYSIFVVDAVFIIIIVCHCAYRNTLVILEINVNYNKLGLLNEKWNKMGKKERNLNKWTKRDRESVDRGRERGGVRQGERAPWNTHKIYSNEQKISHALSRNFSTDNNWPICRHWMECTFYHRKHSPLLIPFELTGWSRWMCVCASLRFLILNIHVLFRIWKHLSLVGSLNGWCEVKCKNNSGRSSSNNNNKHMHTANYNYKSYSIGQNIRINASQSVIWHSNGSNVLKRKQIAPTLDCFLPSKHFYGNFRHCKTKTLPFDCTVRIL